jgi:hypothetical protein
LLYLLQDYRINATAAGIGAVSIAASMAMISSAVAASSPA